MSEYEMEKFEESLKDKIYSIRGFQVMLSRDLAELYGVETKVLSYGAEVEVVSPPELREQWQQKIREMGGKFCR